MVSCSTVLTLFVISIYNPFCSNLSLQNLVDAFTIDMICMCPTTPAMVLQNKRITAYNDLYI